LNRSISPKQNCSIKNASGEIDSSNITNVNVTCDNLDLVFSNGFETNTKSLKPNQFKKDNPNYKTILGPQMPQVIPSLNFYGLMLLLFGFLIMARFKIAKPLSH
jgi:hypothetical protein